MKHATKQPDRIILFEIGVIVALLLINWLMNLAYMPHHFEEVYDPIPIMDSAFIYEPYIEKIQEKQHQQQASIIPFNPISSIKLIDNFLKFDEFQSKDPAKPKGPMKLISFKTTGQSSKIDSFAAVMPQFPGGDIALSRFIQSEFKFNDRMFDMASNIHLVVSFVVRKDGKITDIEVLNCDVPYVGAEQEAIILCEKMPNWIPGSNGIYPVNVRLILPLTIQIY